MQSPSSMKMPWASRPLLGTAGVSSCLALYWWHLGAPRSTTGMLTGATLGMMCATIQAADRAWAA